MKMKKILAALAACAMAVSMLSLTVSAAGVEDDGTDLDENEVIDTIDDDVVDDDDDVFDDDDVVADDDTVADDTADVADETAGNPATGNSPIALAVIPVALAAAAVVAKKASK
ncbi:MAG: hypothetical protein ACI4SF_01180 [Oscillospiraceae bacterium]